jgi:hypothetical protein
LLSPFDEALSEWKQQQAPTFEALDLIRRDTELALHQNASAISNQLAQLSIALVNHSERQFELMRATEKRSLRVTLFILGVVLLAGAAIVWLAARALIGATRKLQTAAGIPAITGEGVPSQLPWELPNLLLDQAASAYAAALGDVEKRLMALEQRQPQNGAETIEAIPESRDATQAVRNAAVPSKARQVPRLAMALGDGEAILFLPHDAHTSSSPLLAWFTRLGRFFAHPRASKSRRAAAGTRFNR